MSQDKTNDHPYHHYDEDVAHDIDIEEELIQMKKGNWCKKLSKYLSNKNKYLVMIGLYILAGLSPVYIIFGSIIMLSNACNKIWIVLCLINPVKFSIYI